MNQITLWGIHAVEALLTQNPNNIHCLLIYKQRNDTRIERLLKMAAEHNIPVKLQSKEQLDKYSNVHQGVVAFCNENSAVFTEEDLFALVNEKNEKQQSVLLLILDGVTDPHNLGACLRTAAAMSVDAVIVPKDRAVGLNATVRKVASGGAELVPLVSVTNLSRTMRQLKELGVWFYGTQANAKQTLHSANLSGSVAWVLGAEGEGLRHNTEKQCDHLVSIPMPGAMESLNVSVACGICLYETIRQLGSV